MFIIHLTTIIDPISALIGLWMLRTNKNGLSGALQVMAVMRSSRMWCLYFRFSLSIACAGLVMQTARSFVSAYLSIDMPDRIMPWWALKDIGLCMAIFGGFIAVKLSRPKK